MVDKSKKTRVSLTLTFPYVAVLDILVEKGLFLDRQDVCREGLRDLFKKHGLALNLGLVPDIP
ncbi:unnamed protein product [marine sediment metagenome]|uniref:Ribbon-helix-helix protein CopG domain-containing protein n=1 Tax=marine sediment metagenome TaxID=412755 RepID=X1N9B0_9ZZZZ